MKINLNKKIIVFGIIVIFFGAVVIPSITGNIEKNDIKFLEESYLSLKCLLLLLFGLRQRRRFDYFGEIALKFA